MFVARTGLKTRPGTASGAQQSGLTALLAPKRKRKEDKVGFYCWIPFMLRPCIAVFVGLFVLLGGTAMCTVGYYARHLATESVSNGTHIIEMVDDAKRYHINNLTYIGPVIMGCGCFMIVVACVVVCEYRDKQIRVKIEERKRKQLEKSKKKNDFYDRVKNRLKSSVLYQQEGEKVEDKKPIFNGDCEENEGRGTSSGRAHAWLPCISSPDKNPAASAERKYENISKALMNIPMEIFTLEMDTLSGTASLLPVRTDPVAEIEKYKYREDGKAPLRKCPSDSCIPQLLKVNESRLNEVFPERREWTRRKTDGDSREEGSPLNNADDETQVLLIEGKIPGGPCELIMVDETIPLGPGHTENQNTCSSIEGARDDISVTSQVSLETHNAKLFAQDPHSNLHELRCDYNKELSDSGNSINSYGNNSMLYPSNGDCVAMDAPMTSPNVILHQAAVHSDEKGFCGVSLPPVNTPMSVNSGKESLNTGAVESGSVARGNAIGMDTFRQSFSTK